MWGSISVNVIYNILQLDLETQQQDLVPSRSSSFWDNASITIDICQQREILLCWRFLHHILLKQQSISATTFATEPYSFFKADAFY